MQRGRKLSDYPNYLSIRCRGKGVPYYGDGEAREDGDANHGFKNLKTNPELIDSVPELVPDRALRRIVEALNARTSGVLTIGCLSGPVNEDEGHRYTGYVEFSLNSKVGVSDASHYFPPFFQFNQLLHQEKFTEVKFDWVLEGAAFTDVDVDGFTCTVFVNTQSCSNPDEAYSCWERALFLLDALATIPVAEDLIYEAPSETA